MSTEPDAPTCMHEQTISDLATEQGGRWRGNREVTVTSARQEWAAPRISGSGPWASTDPLPTEPPTGECIDYVQSMETISGIDRSEALAIDAANAAAATDTTTEEPDAQ
jgi:hypothetical protein